MSYTLFDFLTLKMEAGRAFETSVTVYLFAKDNVPEDLNLLQHN
jgi:hypothetical protein